MKTIKTAKKVVKICFHFAYVKLNPFQFDDFFFIENSNFAIFEKIVKKQFLNFFRWKMRKIREIGEIVKMYVYAIFSAIINKNSFFGIL